MEKRAVLLSEWCLQSIQLLYPKPMCAFEMTLFCNWIVCLQHALAMFT